MSRGEGRCGERAGVIAPCRGFPAAAEATPACSISPRFCLSTAHKPHVHLRHHGWRSNRCAGEPPTHSLVLCSSSPCWEQTSLRPSRAPLLGSRAAAGRPVRRSPSAERSLGQMSLYFTESGKGATTGQAPGGAIMRTRQCWVVGCAEAVQGSGKYSGQSVNQFWGQALS